jgi:hypothetical protein
MTRAAHWAAHAVAVARRNSHQAGRPLLAAGPEIGRRAGRRLARRELAQVGFLQRVLNWLNRPRGAGNVIPHGWFGLIALILLVLVVVAVVVFLVRPGAVRRAAGQSVLGGQNRTAEDYRRAAELAAAAGDHNAAIVDGVRAIAAELDERQLLPPRPGRTADELAFEAGRELPGLAADLRAVTALFDDVLYGGREGNRAGYELVSRVDEQVRAAKPTAPSASPAPAGLAVPR